MSGFDYGADPVAPVDQYKLWPTEGEMTALIDGDMLPYIVGYTTEETRAMRSYSMAKHMFGGEPEPDNWAWMEVMLKQPYFKDKVDHLNTLLNQWVVTAKADSALIYMTDSAKNYRIDIAFSHPYKGERNPSKPPFFYELRHYLRKMHNAIVSDGNEADDLMSIEQWRRAKALGISEADVGSQRHKTFADSIIVSKDKDLRIVPGWNCNPDTGDIVWVDQLGYLEPKYVEKESVKYEWWPLFSGQTVDPKGSDCYEENGLYYLVDGTCQDVVTRGKDKGKPKTKRVKAGYFMDTVIDDLKGGGLKFFYAQLIMGDTVDNYKGIPGAGATLAFNTLNHLTTEEELYEAVYNLYVSKRCSGGSEIWVENYRGGRALLSPLQLMVEQGRLAHMQRLAGDIWRSDLYCPTGVQEGVWKTG